MHLMGRYLAASWAARTWREVAYLLVGLPVAILLFVYAVTMYALGVGLAVIWIGVPILVAVQASLRPLGTFERACAVHLLDDTIPPPAPLEIDAGTSAARRAFAPFHDAHSWRVLAWIGIRMVLAPIGFALAVVQLVVPISLVAAVLLSFAHLFGWTDGWLQADDADAAAVVETVSFWTAVGSPVLILLAAMPAWMVRGVSEVHRWAARWALGICDRDVAKAATARAQLAEEQVRIDQELHDSIGHMITMNIIQAGAGAHVFDSDPEFARQALRTIEQRGRAAMGELDRILATIRGDHQGERAPLSGIAEIPRLVEASRAAGMTVEAQIETPEVPAAIGRAAFGIVREALTNAARHAPGAAVTVSVGRVDDALGIDVVNGQGTVTTPAREDRARHGVSGMRDRVTLLGGRTCIGPEPGGGYRVRALLPLEAVLDARATGSTWDDLRVEVTA